MGSLALAGSARAVLLVNSHGHSTGGKWQRWADGSREPTIGGPIRFSLHVPRGCGRAEGCSLRRGGVVRAIYLRRGAPDARFALMHELGHAFDTRYLTRREHRRFEYLDGWGHHDGYGYSPWWIGGSDPSGSPAEDFANTYASCAIYGLRPRVWYMNLWKGWDSGWASYRAACRMIRRGGARP